MISLVQMLNVLCRKYKEGYHVGATQFADITDNTYTKEEVC